MAKLKTQKTKANPQEFIESIEHKKRREDGLKLLELFNKWTGEKPAMWGPSIVGYGNLKYTRSDGNTFDWFYVGFSPRKTSLSLYVSASHESNAKYLEKLGKHKMGSGCLYVNKLEDIDLNVLEKIVANGMKIDGGC